MSELIWFNGQILPMAEARVSVEDRGFQFADGVYEAMRIYGGRAFAMTPHLDRLEQSAAALVLPMSMDKPALAAEIDRLIAQSGVRDGLLYLQLTRGACPRNHVLPSERCEPTLLFYARPLPPIVPPDEQPGAKLLTVPDDRWRRCWIKTIALIANVMARNEAAARGCDEAAFVDEHGIVAECTSSNLFAVINGDLVTHPVGPRVLGGITRWAILRCARELDVNVIERPLSLAEAKSADEIFIASTTRQIVRVREWDGHPVGGGRCGPIILRLHDALEAMIRRDTRQID